MLKVVFFIFLFFGNIGFSKEISQNKRYNLSICAIFKNEAKFLKEWIEYHRIIGIDHFYLYNVESSDHFRNILNPYIREGLITLVQWPNLGKFQSDEIWMLSTQIPAYENAIKFRALYETKWLVFVDIDEFLVPPFNNNLSEMLDKYESYQGVILTSDCFDVANQHSIPKRRLIIETKERVSLPLRKDNREVVKMIFKPNEVKYFTWPPYKFVFKNKESVIVLSRNYLRINRYINRSDESFFYNKQKVVVDHRNMSESEITDLLRRGYAIENLDNPISRFIPEVIKRMGLN